MTYTYVFVDVSSQTFREVYAALEAADYGHAFHDGGQTIDLHGLALRENPEMFPSQAQADAFQRGTAATHQLFLEACQILPEELRTALGDRCRELASMILQPAEVQS